MAYKLIITQAAHEDLGGALDYIATRLANPSAAANLLSQVEACYEHLRAHPLMYAPCHNTRLRALGYRKAVIGNYVLVFRPDEATQTIYILRYFYGARDYEKLL